MPIVYPTSLDCDGTYRIKLCSSYSVVVISYYRYRIFF